MHAIKPNFWPRSSKSAPGQTTQIKSLYFSQTVRGSRNGERLLNRVTEAPKRHSASQHQTSLFNSSRAIISSDLYDAVREMQVMMDPILLTLPI
jgi:hypothetical protein